LREDGRAAEGKTFGMPGFFILDSQNKEVVNMNSTMTIEQVLRAKGHDFFAISPNATAYEALEFMAEKNIGALLVVEDESLSAFSQSGIMRGR
jgi:CBS domain-containing protein